MADQIRDEETGRATKLVLDRYDCEHLDMLVQVATDEIAHILERLNPQETEYALHKQLLEWMMKVRKQAYEVAYEDDGAIDYKWRNRA